MKIFKYLALFFLLLIASFFILGLVTPSVVYENKVTVNAPIEKAFALFMDTTKMKEWIPGFVSIKNDSGDLTTPGSKLHLVLLQEEQKYEMTEVVTTYKPNQQYSYLLENAVLRNNVDIRFKAIGNQTEIKAHNYVRGNSIIWRSIFFFYKKEFFDQGQKTVDDLKKMIENS